MAGLNNFMVSNGGNCSKLQNAFDITNSFEIIYHLNNNAYVLVSGRNMLWDITDQTNSRRTTSSFIEWQNFIKPDFGFSLLSELSDTFAKLGVSAD